jgi:hypothetical protein
MDLAGLGVSPDPLPAVRTSQRRASRADVRRLTFLTAGLCWAVAQAAAPADAAPVKAEMADRIVDMIGVNTHVGFRGTIYDTGFATIVKPRLLELGVRHIRDSPGPAGDALVKGRYVDLAQNGIRVLMINWPERGQGQDYVKELDAAAGFPVVEAVEPPNERDITWRYDDFGPEWPGRLRDYMQAMYPAYKGDPATAGITVLGPSFANTRDSALRLAGEFPGATAYMAAGNLHDYSGLNPENPRAGGWGLALTASLQRYRSLAGAKPLWTTENGYKQSGSVPGHPAVTSRAAAKYLPRQLLMHFRYGVSRLYIYELINETWENFGLLDNNGQPRQQYWSVKRFINTMKDPGGEFETGYLDYELTGNLADIYTALFQKRDGRFYLVVWQGVASVQGTKDSTIADIEQPVRRLTLNVRSRITQARLYRPLTATRPRAVYSDAAGLDSVPLSVPDDVLIVELTP